MLQTSEQTGRARSDGILKFVFITVIPFDRAPTSSDNVRVLPFSNP